MKPETNHQEIMAKIQAQNKQILELQRKNKLLNRKLKTIQQSERRFNRRMRKQRTIGQMFGKMAKPINLIQKPADKKYVLARQLAIVCALDFEPFSLSHRRGFQQFCEWNNINLETLPDPRSIAETGLSDVYEFALGQIKSMLQKAAPKSIGLTLDCWTDNCVNRSFINFRAHFADSKFCMQVFTLKTEIFPHPHTGLRIGNNISQTLLDFGLNEKLVFAVSDNGANVVAGIRNAKLNRISCSAHNLHLFVSKDILKSENFAVILALI